MSNPGDYTVGWICAVGVELVAAQVFLDERHADLVHQPINDNNTYIFGRVRHHNVVIAALPHSQYGLVSAATVARDLVRSFPNVRLGLMVGIGGGAPSSRHDIRLGDVVVSSPGDGSGGVLQYDYGKTIQDKRFTLTGYLNQPPQFMLTAISVLDSKYVVDDNGLQQAIEGVLEKKKKLQSKYQRPDASTDRLYQSSYIHIGGKEDSCEAFCGDDASCLVSRAERMEDQDSPAIHYGLIASANQLMKDALIRDRLSAEKDILCFEMEAAGLMNHFPCLVIRGVCDYADTHKNSAWQGYAAMAAAAYAKDLLSTITPNKIEAERRLSEVLAAVHERVEDVYDLTKVTNTGIEGLQADSHSKRIRTWLSPPDPSENLNKALKRRQQGSGQWLIQCDEYAAWKTEQDSFLWLYGIPGCGKTILSSTVIEDLGQSQSSSMSFLYYYFDFSNSQKQSLENAVRSLISQLYYKKSDVREHLDSLYNSCIDGNQQPSDHALRKAFESMIQKTDQIWIVLDALDECQRRNQYPDIGLLEWFRFLQGEKGNVHLIVTSRPEQDIKSAIDRYQSGSKHSIPIQSDSVEQDIKAYIRARIRSDSGLRRWRSNPEVQNEIEAALTEKADGMFRWVECQLDVLEECLDPPAVRKALGSLPKTLDDTYARILENIPEDFMKHTKRMLQFLTYSERAVTIREAVDALAVEIEPRLPFDPDNRMPDPTEITRYCSSLVMVITGSDYASSPRTESVISDIDDQRTIVGSDTDDDFWESEIQLSHFSVREYLTSERLPEFLAKDLGTIVARTAIVQVSLAYLLGIDHSGSARQIVQKYPFAYYAALYWGIQAEMVGEYSQETRWLIAEFFSCASAYQTCYRLYNIYSFFGIPPSPLYYASSGGLLRCCQLLLDDGAVVNAQGGDMGNALQAASDAGDEEIVKLLLDHGADINAWGGIRRVYNALHAASNRGHTETVKILLEHGADIHAQGGIEGTENALYLALRGGHTETALLLLENGADIQAQGRIGGMDDALLGASQWGRKEIVKILLGHSADIFTQGGASGLDVALYAASYGGRTGIVEMLLGHGAGIMPVRCGETRAMDVALDVALHCGFTEIVQMLRDKGAEQESSRLVG